MFRRRSKATEEGADLASFADDYRSYVEHPRYGRGPRITGLNPTRATEPGTLAWHWHTRDDQRIPNTAVAADLDKQAPATMPVAYYFDARRICRDCSRKFIFFAEEQKHWYETLGFNLEADCVRCWECRRHQRGDVYARDRYNELIAIDNPSPSECLELVETSIALIKCGTFPRHPRTFARVRMWLNRAARFPDVEVQRVRLLSEVKALEEPSPGAM